MAIAKSVPLLFDFDGVLFDSVDEVVCSAFNTLSGELLTRLNQLPPDYKAWMTLNRSRVRLSSDILPVARFCLTPPAGEPRTLTIEEIDELIARDISPLSKRTADFFAGRARFIEADQGQWLALHRPYEPLWSSLKNFGGDSIVILTNKDAKPVELLAEYFGIKLLRENIFAGDDASSKEERFRMVCEKFGAERYAFLEDALGNLLGITAVNPNMIEPRLAQWGYVCAEDIEVARAGGIPVVTQQQICDRLTLSDGVLSLMMD